MKERINVMIDDSLLDLINKESQRYCISRSAYISLALSSYISVSLEVREELKSDKKIEPSH